MVPLFYAVRVRCFNAELLETEGCGFFSLQLTLVGASARGLKRKKKSGVKFGCGTFNRPERIKRKKGILE
jgi:hypothetical protein